MPLRTLVRDCVWLLALLIGVAPAAGEASATDPTLALTRVSSVKGQAGRLVQLVGVFPAEDLIQRAHPIEVLIVRGTSFARFSLAGGVWVGSAPELADGLDASDWPAVLAASAPSATGRIASTGGDRIEVMLPSAHPGGIATAQLFLERPLVISNAITFSVSAP